MATDDESVSGGAADGPLNEGRVGDAVPTTKQLLRWSESLAAVARTGLGFTQSLYERERFEEILHIAADIRSVTEGHQHEDAAGLVVDWLGSVGQGVPGYVTPKVSVGAVVGNDKGEILLVQRADSGFWLYPTGWADVGYSAPEVVVKEVKEETGIEVDVVRLVAVLDGLRLGISHAEFYSLIFQCRVVGGELDPHPLECSDVGWFAEDALPSPMIGVDIWKEHMFAALRGEVADVLYHNVRRPVWQGDPGRL